MFELRQTVSLLLFGVGGLLVLLGVTVWLIESSEPDSDALARAVFSIGAILGLALISWAISIRSQKPGGADWPLWVTYLALLAPLVGLVVFVGAEVFQLFGENWQELSYWERRRIGRGIVGLVFIFLGPVILLFRQRSPSKDQQKR
jgi:hypothetical protein